MFSKLQIMFVTFKLYWIILIILIASELTISSTSAHDKIFEEDEGDEDYIFLITGGYRPVNHSLAKYIVSMRAGNSEEYRGDNHYCSGVIIKPNIILTAAQCVLNSLEQPTSKLLTVVAGSQYLLKVPESTRTCKIIRVVAHRNFTFRTMESDIALAFLEQSIELDQETKSVVALAETSPKAGMECVTFGWGRIFPEGPRPDELVYLNLTLRECYRGKPDVICAVDEQNLEKKTWKGEAGDPLICDGKLSGIISLRNKKNISAPNFFTNVYQYRQWILENCSQRIQLSLCNLLVVLILGFYSALCG